MPSLGVESIPIPTLRSYTILSLGLFLASIYYAHEISYSRFLDESTNHGINESMANCHYAKSEQSLMFSWTQTASVMLEELWCVWVSLMSVKFDSIYVKNGKIKIFQSFHIAFYFTCTDIEYCN